MTIAFTRAVLEQPITWQEAIKSREDGFPLKWIAIWTQLAKFQTRKMRRTCHRVTFQTSKYRTRIYQNVSRFNLFPIITHLKITSSCKVIKLTLSVGKVRFSTRMISPQLDWKLRFKFSQGLSPECKSRWLCETLNIASSLDCLFNFYIFFSLKRFVKHIT